MNSFHIHSGIFARKRWLIMFNLFNFSAVSPTNESLDIPYILWGNKRTLKKEIYIFVLWLIYPLKDHTTQTQQPNFKVNNLSGENNLLKFSEFTHGDKHTLLLKSHWSKLGFLFTTLALQWQTFLRLPPPDGLTASQEAKLTCQTTGGTEM